MKQSENRLKSKEVIGHHFTVDESGIYKTKEKPEKTGDAEWMVQNANRPFVPNQEGR